MLLTILFMVWIYDVPFAEADQELAAYWQKDAVGTEEVQCDVNKIIIMKYVKHIVTSYQMSHQDACYTAPIATAKPHTLCG